MDDDTKRRLKMMLRRIQGQVGGVERMIESGKSVEDVLTQISAAMSSLKSVGRILSVEEAVKLGLDERRRDKYDRLVKRLI